MSAILDFKMAALHYMAASRSTFVVILGSNDMILGLRESHSDPVRTVYGEGDYDEGCDDAIQTEDAASVMEGEVTSQSLRSRHGRHFVGVARHNALS